MLQTMLVENCIWLKTGNYWDRQKSLIMTHIRKIYMGCAVHYVCPQKERLWVKHISIEAGMEIGSQKRPNSGPACQGKGAHTVSLLISSKQNWINSQRNVRSNLLDANLNVWYCVNGGDPARRKGVLRSEPGRTADIVFNQYSPKQVFSWRAFICLASAYPLLFEISVEDGSAHFFPVWSSFKSSQRTFHLLSCQVCWSWNGREVKMLKQVKIPAEKKPQRG